MWVPGIVLAVISGCMTLYNLVMLHGYRSLRRRSKQKMKTDFRTIARYLLPAQSLLQAVAGVVAQYGMAVPAFSVATNGIEELFVLNCMLALHLFIFFSLRAITDITWASSGADVSVAHSFVRKLRVWCICSCVLYTGSMIAHITTAVVTNSMVLLPFRKGALAIVSLGCMIASLYTRWRVLHEASSQKHDVKTYGRTCVVIAVCSFAGAVDSIMSIVELSGLPAKALVATQTESWFGASLNVAITLACTAVYRKHQVRPFSSPYDGANSSAKVSSSAKVCDIQVRSPHASRPPPLETEDQALLHASIYVK